METIAPHITKKQYPVKGMSCAACASSVESMLKSQEGVKEANVNFASHSVSVAYDAASISPAQLKKTLDEIGYELVTETINAEQLKADKLATLKMLKRKLLVSTVFSVPVFVLSMFMIEIPYKNLVLLLLSIPVIFYSGRSFYVNAWKKIKHGTTNMDTLISLGTGAAFLFSLFNTIFPDYLLQFGLQPHVYYESAVVIITLILFGNYMEEKAKDRTSTAIEKLIGLQPREAHLIKNGEVIIVNIDEVTVGDILLIKPGAKIPLDGEVINGSSYVDESMVTGEPEHALKKEGEKVVGGTINQIGSLEMRVEKVGEDTMLSRIIKMVQDAQGSKAPAQKLADKISSIFVPVVIIIAILSFTLWMILGPGFSTAFVVLVTVLIIACPCALGLATPTAITVGIGKGANNGILIKDAEALEKVKDIDVLLVDKTGTITEGKPTVNEFIISKNHDEPTVLGILYLLEQKSEHPLAKAIIDYLQKQKINTQGIQLQDFQSITGEGVEGIISNDKYFAGSMARLKNRQVTVDDSIGKKLQQL
ncbi:MAG: heavy metal translocating P-type ATPase, partial [Cyclobacteriaceae bacterium]